MIEHKNIPVLYHAAEVLNENDRNLVDFKDTVLGKVAYLGKTPIVLVLDLILQQHKFVQITVVTL